MSIRDRCRSVRFVVGAFNSQRINAKKEKKYGVRADAFRYGKGTQKQNFFELKPLLKYSITFSNFCDL